LATKSVPTSVPEPGLFSTTKACPACLPMRSASRRATKSKPPPGGCGTITLTGCDGYVVCAAAGTAPITAAASSAAENRSLFMA
jgi:hypothetical protein